MTLTVLVGCGYHAAKNDAAAAGSQREWKTGEKIENSLGMELVLIPAGTFKMGSPASEVTHGVGHRDEESQVFVTISNSYYLGRTEVTRDQWKRVMQSEPWNRERPEFREEGTNLPATDVTWDDATVFCERLGALEGREYRLPTEAEWEFACRAGTTTAYCFGDDLKQLSDYAWWGGYVDPNLIRTRPAGSAQREKRVHSVALKKPNSFGLFDMHGNAAEWCADAYTLQLPGGKDPYVRSGGWNRGFVYRGGDWSMPPDECRSAARKYEVNNNKGSTLGFRVALTSSSEAAIALDNTTVGATQTATAPLEPEKHDKRITNSLGMTLVWIPAGTFKMGSPANEAGRFHDEGQVEVTLTKPFYMAMTVVTQLQWKRLMSTEPWKGQVYAREGNNFPATYVSWKDAQEFCIKLSSDEGKNYRLPTEAQWEYACRAGTKTAYYFGDDASQLSNYAWWGGLTDGNAKPEQCSYEVGLKRPNTFGLFDMHGNVCQWCRDVYLEKLPGGRDPLVVPADSTGGIERVNRGGTWMIPAKDCRSASRFVNSQGMTGPSTGLRVVLIP